MEPFYKEQELILNQIYSYCINKTTIKNIPLEKIVLNILCNVPMPSRGVFEISYKFNYKDINNEEIKIKRAKYNELINIDSYILFMLSIYTVDDLIEIFKYMIYEIKTLVFSTKVNDLCFFINGLLCILFPFSSIH